MLQITYFAKVNSALVNVTRVRCAGCRSIEDLVISRRISAVINATFENWTTAAAASRLPRILSPASRVLVS